MTIYGKAEARKNLAELVSRARDGETISLGMRGVPEAKLVSYLTPTLSDVDLATLARGLGEAQAHRQFNSGVHIRQIPGAEKDVLRLLPDNLAADVVKHFTEMPSTRDFAAEYLTALVRTTASLYEESELDMPTVQDLIEGISLSSGDHPALAELLMGTVMPKVAAILRHILEEQGRRG